MTASAAVLIGVGHQEAFELLQIWGFTFYAIAYLASVRDSAVPSRISSLAFARSG